MPEFAVTQEVDGGEPQVLGCAAELGFAQVGYRGVTHEVFWIYSTCLAAGGAEQHHPVSAPGVERERAAHAKGFVVWMRQHSQQSSWGRVQCSLRVHHLRCQVGKS